MERPRGTERHPQPPPRDVRVRSGKVDLDGTLTIPGNPEGIILFAHGSGSSRFSPRNQAVARTLQGARLGTLLLDLLTPEEEEIDLRTRQFRFDIGLLADRLIGAVDWLGRQPETRSLPIGLFGASTGAAAALITAAERPTAAHAVVSRGGRPDLAEPYLSRVYAPTLLIVGSLDTEVIALNQEALRGLHDVKELALVPGASHLFEEPGTLDEVARLARIWFARYLPAGIAAAGTLPNPPQEGLGLE
jgi:dipeptidyl aminopeptidase/acylaminoacyl peptidase